MPTAAWDFQGQPKYLSLHMNVILRNKNIYQCIYEWIIMLPKYLSLHMNVLSSNQNIFRISFFELCANFVKEN